MTRSFSWAAPKYWRTRVARDALLVAVVSGTAFIAVSGVSPANQHALGDALLVCGAVAAVAAIQIFALDRLVWHLAANLTALEKPLPLLDPWVIDGDTIDDRFTGVRYRLANIDAPETGDNAKCFKENERGEQASRAAIEFVRRAKTVTVRRTWRFDRFGRRVAFVLVDGEDLGRVLIRLGFARPWRGKRRKWCGRRGGLALIAKSGAMAHVCQRCGDWR